MNYQSKEEMLLAGSDSVVSNQIFAFTEKQFVHN